jgi:hypothetical protein
MTEEILLDREVEFLTYLRNNITDPSNRGTLKTDTFIAEGGNGEFALTEVLVKNVVSVKINGSMLYIGHDYVINYGEGNDPTYVEIISPPGLNDEVEIIYRYGKSMINFGWGRDEQELPRIAIIPRAVTTEHTSIGEHLGGGGNNIYLIGSYTMEIRSSYAKQMKLIMSELMNKFNSFRHQTPNPFRHVNSKITLIQPQDFDNELRLYRCYVNVEIRWLERFN